jgi:hypothetical protein
MNRSRCFVLVHVSLHCWDWATIAIGKKEGKGKGAALLVLGRPELLG